MRHRCAWLALLLAVGARADDTCRVPLTDPGTGTFYVAGRLGETVRLQMLVDTGASYTSIGRDVFERLRRTGGIRYLGERSGRLADGRAVTIPLYRVQRLRIGDRCEVNDVEVAVFPAGDRAILGLNVLARLSPFSIATDPPHLSLSGCRSAADERPSLAAAP